MRVGKAPTASVRGDQLRQRNGVNFVADAGEVAEEGLVNRAGVVIESARDREIEFHSFGIRSGLSDGFEEFRQPSHTRQADVASSKLVRFSEF